MTPPSGTQFDFSHSVAGLAAVQSEQLFRAMFEQAAVGMALIETTTGRFLRVNRRYAEIAGLSQNDMTATTFMAITHPDDLQTDLRNMEELKAGRIRDFSMEKRYFRSDGSIVWVDLTVSPLWGVGEQPNFHIAVVQDISERKQAEQNVIQLNATLEHQVLQRTHELQESRQQLQAILDGTSDAVFIKDRAGRYLLINRAVERFVGKRQEEVIGQDDRFIFPPADAEAVMEADRKVMTGGETTTYEDNVTTVDGMERTFLSTKGPLFDSQGRVTGLFGISRDITKRKHAEKALRESEERFRRIFEYAGIGIAITDMNGRFLRCNPAYCSLLGYSEAEFHDLTFSMLVHPDDLASNMAEIKRVIFQELPWCEVENRYCRKDGRDVWVRKFVSVLRNESGQPTNLFALVTDVTERRRMHTVLEQRIAERTAEVREREAVLTRLITHFPGVISRVGRDLTYRFVSPQYEEWFGKKPDDIIGRAIVDVIGRDAFERSKAGIERVLSGQSIRFENSVTTSTGEARHTLVTLEPELDRDGVCAGFMVFALDITGRKQVEQALRVSETFKKEVLDSLSAQVAVLDASGVIVAVNRVWKQAETELDPDGRCHLGVGANYLQVCRQAADESVEAKQVLEGIGEVLSKQRQFFETQYRCMTPGGSRWFVMRVTPLSHHDGGAVVVHEDITQRKQAEEEVHAAYRRLQSLSREVQVATERERNRLSRELHDEFGQLLSALKFDLSRMASGSGRKSASPPSVGRKIATDAMGIVDRLFRSLHEMIRALRPVVLEQLGLIPAIETLVTDMRERWGLQCRLMVKRKEFRTSFGAAMEDALYRVAQELLTNVARHADARSVTITLGRADAWVYLTVQDDGKGFRVASVRRKGRYGLRGVRERAEMLGGKVEIRSAPGKGTCVTMRIPMGLDTSDRKTEEMPRHAKP